MALGPPLGLRPRLPLRLRAPRLAGEGGMLCRGTSRGSSIGAPLYLLIGNVIADSLLSCLNELSEMEAFNVLFLV